MLFFFSQATEEDNTQPLANRTTETTIIIRVLDVDDEIPKFDKGYVKVKLYENAPVETALNLGVTVTDDDEVTLLKYIGCLKMADNLYHIFCETFMVAFAIIYFLFHKNNCENCNFCIE